MYTALHVFTRFTFQNTGFLRWMEFIVRQTNELLFEEFSENKQSRNVDSMQKHMHYLIYKTLLEH